MKRKSQAGSPDAVACPVVRLQVATRRGRIPAAARFRLWAQAAAPGHAGVLTIRLVGEAESRRLNEGFRGKHGPTNVLAFPARRAPTAAEAELGDLLICLPLVYREAREQGKKPLDHLAHLVVHGTLHLMGHDHDQAAKARRMENAEVRMLRGLGVGNPYREQAPGRVRRRTTT
jgi:probable rRNA maturation factor